MFDYKLLENNAGILLCGGYGPLRCLGDVVFEVSEQSDIIKDKEGAFLALAYDARKAYEGQRQVLKPSPHFPEIGILYGVEILWPVLLVQARMLRASLAYLDSTKRQQAITYALEDVIEAAIEEAFGNDAKRITERWYHVNPAHPWPEEKLASRGAQFCKWTSAQRKAGLYGLLISLDPMYSLMYAQMKKNGATDLLVPEDELDALADEEWQDPKW